MASILSGFTKLWSSLAHCFKHPVLESCKPFLPNYRLSPSTISSSSAVFIAFYAKLRGDNNALSYGLHYFSHDSLCIITSVFFLLTVGIFIIYHSVRPLPCYLVDFCCTKGDDRDSASIANFLSFLRTWKSLTDRNLKFQLKVFCKSGVGEEAYAAPALLQKGEDVDMQDARLESEKMIADAAERLLKKTGVDSKEIGIVIVNSSVFNPSPSMATYVVNVLNMRSNVKTFNLAGMGCSGGLIGIDLAARLLKIHRNSYALIVSTENNTSSLYFGNDRSMMVTNCLFRCGCSAVLLTNKSSARAHAKMQLLHSLRTGLAADNKAYKCVEQMEDAEGKVGVSLQVSLLEVAEDALRNNITRLAPRILPWSEIMKVAVNVVKKRDLRKGVEAYQPNFKKAVDHFCIHPGGRAVIDAVGKGLKLSEFDVEPGKMALERFGNTSSSGIWYALGYCEAKGRLKKGNKVWQIALGSGFKCNSAVWRVLRDIEPWDNMVCNPWLSCIDRYPVPQHVVENRAAKVKDIDSLFQTNGEEEHVLKA